jgi:hypothetical protein
MIWAENQYHGWRNTDNTLYVGCTTRRFYRVWQRGTDGWVDTRAVFATAAAAKAHAETLTPRLEPTRTEMRLVVTGADAHRVTAVLEQFGVVVHHALEAAA